MEKALTAWLNSYKGVSGVLSDYADGVALMSVCRDICPEHDFGGATEDLSGVAACMAAFYKVRRVFQGYTVKEAGWVGGVRVYMHVVRAAWECAAPSVRRVLRLRRAAHKAPRNRQGPKAAKRLDCHTFFAPPDHSPSARPPSRPRARACSGR